MALGASRWSALRLVLQQGMTLVCIGTRIDIAVSPPLGRVFSRMLFGLSSADPSSVLGTSAVLILVG